MVALAGLTRPHVWRRLAPFAREGWRSTLVTTSNGTRNRGERAGGLVWRAVEGRAGDP
jgi:hypothetical protein